MLSLIKKILVLITLCLITVPAFAEKTILVLGDSLSAGYGIPIEKGWVALLQARINDRALLYKVVNASTSGDTTRNGLERLPNLMKTHHPAIVMIELGGNDGLRGTPLTAIAKNLRSMIDIIQEQDAQPILIGVRLPPNLGPDYTLAFAEMYKTLANHSEIPLVPSLLAGLELDMKNFQPDGIHPVEAAQPMMMENVWVVLRAVLT